MYKLLFNEISGCKLWWSWIQMPAFVIFLGNNSRFQFLSFPARFCCFLTFPISSFPSLCLCQMKWMSLLPLPPYAFCPIFYTLIWGSNALSHTLYSYPFLSLFVFTIRPACIISFHWELHRWIDDLLQMFTRHSVCYISSLRKTCEATWWKHLPLWNLKYRNKGSWSIIMAAYIFPDLHEILTKLDCDFKKCRLSLFYNMRKAFHRFKSKHYVSIAIISRERGVAIVAIISFCSSTKGHHLHWKQFIL